MTEPVHEVYRKKGVRLSAELSPLLSKYFYAAMKGKAWKGFHMFDKAHTVVITEEGIIPKGAGTAILNAVRKMEAEGVERVRESLGGHMHCGEAYATMTAGSELAGWMHVGRSSGDLQAVAVRVDARDLEVALMKGLIRLRRTLLGRAEEHVHTMMPGYTHLQHAEPITLAFYLLSFVHQLERDFERFQGAYRRTNLSPAGSGSVNGSRLPLDRARLAELLGFDGLVSHTRDAMWQADGPIEIAALVTSALVTLDRLAEDLQIFSTVEFGLVELADRHTRASVIMPQKKNPYSLAYIRGLCGESIGNLAAMAAVGKTPSGQIDNRLFAYGDIPRALDRVIGASRLTADVLRGLTVNTDLAARRASENFIGATDLAEVIMLQGRSMEHPNGIDYKTAHDIVGRAVRAAIESAANSRGGSQTPPYAELLDEAAEAMIGRKLNLDSQLVADALDPARMVAARTGPGGAAEAPVAQMIAECRAALADHNRWREATQTRLDAAETTLLMTAASLKATLPSRPEESAREAAVEPPPQRSGEPKSLEELADELFKDLPPPPNRRRFRR